MSGYSAVTTEVAIDAAGGDKLFLLVELGDPPVAVSQEGARCESIITQRPHIGVRIQRGKDVLAVSLDLGDLYDALRVIDLAAWRVKG